MVRRGSFTTRRSAKRRRRLLSATALSFSPRADQTGVLTYPCLCLRICLCLSLHGQNGQVSSPILVFDLSLYFLLFLSLSLSLSFFWNGRPDRCPNLSPRNFLPESVLHFLPDQHNKPHTHVSVSTHVHTTMQLPIHLSHPPLNSLNSNQLESTQVNSNQLMSIQVNSYQP